MDKEKVLQLAGLARIELSDQEASNLVGEFDQILAYVGEVKDAPQTSKISSDTHYALENVMRDDLEPHEPGLYTKQILKQAPNTEGDYIKVKKIL